MADQANADVAALTAEAARAEIIRLRVEAAKVAADGNKAVLDALAKQLTKEPVDKHRPEQQQMFGWKRTEVVVDGKTSVKWPVIKSTEVLDLSIPIKVEESHIASLPREVSTYASCRGILPPLGPCSDVVTVGNHGLDDEGRYFSSAPKDRSIDEANERLWGSKEPYMDFFSWIKAAFMMGAFIDANSLKESGDLRDRWMGHVEDVVKRATPRTWPIYAYYDFLIRKGINDFLRVKKFPDWLGKWQQTQFKAAMGKLDASEEDCRQTSPEGQWMRIVQAGKADWKKAKEELDIVNKATVKGLRMPSPSLTMLRVVGDPLPLSYSYPSASSPRTFAPLPSSSQQYGGPSTYSYAPQPFVPPPPPPPPPQQGYDPWGAWRYPQGQYPAPYLNQGGNNSNSGKKPQNQNQNQNQNGKSNAKKVKGSGSLCIGCTNPDANHSLPECTALTDRLCRAEGTNDKGILVQLVKARQPQPGSNGVVCTNFNKNHACSINGHDHACTRCGGLHPLVFCPLPYQPRQQ